MIKKLLIAVTMALVVNTHNVAPMGFARNTWNNVKGATIAGIQKVKDTAQAGIGMATPAFIRVRSCVTDHTPACIKTAAGTAFNWTLQPVYTYVLKRIINAASHINTPKRLIVATTLAAILYYYGHDMYTYVLTTLLAEDQPNQSALQLCVEQCYSLFTRAANVLNPETLIQHCNEAKALLNKAGTDTAQYLVNRMCWSLENNNKLLEQTLTDLVACARGCNVTLTD